MKTWLAISTEPGCIRSVYRWHDYVDYQTHDWIGNIHLPPKGEPYFYTMGDNRILSRSEAKQISVWLDEFVG